MTALTIIETLLLVLALIYIVALLRSHADILRRLAALEKGVGVAAPVGGVAAPVGGVASTTDAVRAAGDIAGVTLDGNAVKVSLGAGSPPTLLAFLTSGCAACGAFWEGFRDEGTLTSFDERVVVITHDPSSESVTRLRELAPADVEVIMAGAAWTAYGVPSSPHFVLTDGHGGVSGRGSAPGWSQLLAMVDEARGDVADAITRSARTTAERAQRAELALAQAGIGSGHPSLYPDASPGTNGGAG